MASSLFPGLGQPPDPQKEKMKREEEAKKWEEHTAPFREWYNRQAVYKADKWDLISGTQDMDDENDDQARMVAGDDTIKKKPEFGIYAYNQGKPDEKKYKGCNISYDESGVRPVPPKLGEFDREGWSKSMDFIAGKLGSDTVKLTVPAEPKNPKMARRNLIGMMSMAAEKGLSVEFDKSTLAFIKTLPAKDQIRLLAYQKAVNNNQARVKMALGVNDKGSMVKSNEEIEEQYNKHKLEGPDPSTREANLRAKIYTGVDTTDPDKKTEAVAKHASQLEERLNKVEKVLGRIDEAIEAQRKLIDQPQTAARGSSRLMKSTAWYSTVNREFKKRSKEIDTSIDGKLEVLDSVEKVSEMSKSERKKLRSTLQKELQDINTQKLALKKELEDAKRAMPNPPTQDQAKQIEKMDAQIKRLDDFETRYKGQLTKLSSIGKWDDTERQEKIKDKREQLGAAKKAAVKPS